MTFNQDARRFLEQALLPRLRDFLSESEYVSRLIFRERSTLRPHELSAGSERTEGQPRIKTY
jgi:hypothetical protein